LNSHEVHTTHKRGLEPLEEIHKTRPIKKIKIIKKLKDFKNNLKLAFYEFKDTVEIPNNIVTKNSNFKPGINKKLIVNRIISNKPRLETRTFSTKDFVNEDKETQYEDNFFNTYDNKKIPKITNVIKEKYNLIEQALCSNETVDIFKEDMEELGINGSFESGKFSTSSINRDIKTFLPTSDTDINKNADRQESQIYTVSSIKWVPGMPNVFLIAYAFGKSFEDKIEMLGKTMTYKITFWNAHDQMNPLYTIYTQNETTSMTFHPMDKRILICGLNTGQVMLL